MSRNAYYWAIFTIAKESLASMYSPASLDNPQMGSTLTVWFDIRAWSALSIAWLSDAEELCIEGP